MSRVLEYAREREPQFKDVPDDELTRYIGERKPEFLDDPEFAKEYAKAGEWTYGATVEEPPLLEKAKRFWDEINTPMLEAPRIKPSDVTSLGVPETPAKAVAGAQQALVGAAEYFTSPLGIATLGIGALPKLAQRVIAGAFATQMASHAPDQFAELGRALGSGDVEGASRAVTGTALTGVFVRNLANEAVYGGHGRATVKGEESAPDGGDRQIVETSARAAEGASMPAGLDALLMEGDRRAAAEVVPIEEPVGNAVREQPGFDGTATAMEGEATTPVDEHLMAARRVEQPVEEVAPVPEPEVQADLVDVPPKQVATGEIAVRPDLMQFKKMDDAKSGLNEADKLEGKWDDHKAGLLLLWEPKDPKAYGLTEGEKYIVANGHHRFEFGRQVGRRGFNTQVVREADGVSAADARTLGAEINIADGKGTIYDQAKFIRNAAATHGKDAAVARAGSIGAKGRKAATIALNSGEDLFASFVNEWITPDQAEAIAKASGGNEGLQRLGIKQAGTMEPGQLGNFLEAAKVVGAGAKKADQFDLFGADDSALERAKAMGEVAQAEREAVAEQIRAVQGAANRPEVARKLGVNIEDPNALGERLGQLRRDRERWDNWSLHKDLVARVNAGIDGKEAVAPLPKLQAMQNQGDLLGGDQGGFQLVGEKARDDARLQAEAQRKAADQAESDKQQGGFAALEQWADQTLSDFRKQVGSLNFLDPKVGAALIVKGAYHIGRGINTLAEWSKQMLADYGEEIRPHLMKIWTDAHKHLDGLKARQFPQQVDAAPEVTEAVKEQVRQRFYEPRRNEEDAAWARRIVEEHGLEEAERVVTREGGGVDAARRTALGIVVLKRLGQEEAAARARNDPMGVDAAVRRQVDLMEAVTTRSTELAQGLQAMRMWSEMTPAGQLQNYRRTMERAATTRLGESAGHLQAVKETLNEVNRKVAGEVSADEGVANDVRKAATQGAAEGKAAGEAIREEAREQMPQDAEVESLWGQYAGAAARGLAGILKPKAGKVLLDEFTGRVAGVLKEQMEAVLGVKKDQAAPMQTQLQRLVEGLTNPEKLAEVWERTREVLQQRYKDDPRVAKLLAMQKPKVYTDRLVEAVLREELAAQGRQLGAMAADHFRGGSLGKTLREVIIQKTGLKEAEAAGLAKDLEAAWMRLMNRAEAGRQARVRAAAEREQARQERIAKSRSVWNREKEAVAKGLAARLEAAKAGRPTGPIEEFAGRLAARFREQLSGLFPAKAKGVAKLTDIELLREAVTNADKYEDAWRAAQEEMRAKLSGDPARLAELDRFFGQTGPELFSEGRLERVVRQGMKENGIKLAQVVREHFGAQDRTGKSLADKIAEAAGLKGPEAARLASRLEAKFKQLATARKEAELARLGLPMKIGRLTQKGLHQKLIEMSNLGALDDAKFWDVVREKLDLPAYTKEGAAEVKRRAEAIQRAPEGMQRQKLAVELMNFIAREKGVRLTDLAMAFWYANTLSGGRTHARNVISTLANGLAEAGIMIALRPRSTLDIMAGAGRGLVKGAADAAEVLRTGITTGTRMDKVEAGRALELMQFKGIAAPLNAWKYVMRAMAAEDLVIFKSLEEARVSMLARELAKREGLSGAELHQRVADILGGTEKQVGAAQAQAAAEGLAGLDARRRVQEIIEQARPEELRTDAAEYARRVTFNSKPYGVMGVLAQGMNGVMSKVPLLRLVVPFVNIVANVTNAALDYLPPVGLARAVHGTWSGTLNGRVVKNPIELHEQYAKAVLGTALLSGLAALAAREADKEDPQFMVNGNGPRNAAARKQLMEAGWIPYSIKIGNRYISYAQSPASIPVAILGHYMDAVRYKNLEASDVQNRVAYAFLAAGKVITQQSFLSGLAGVFDALQADSTKSGGQTMLASGARTAASFIVPNALREVDQWFDPKVYDSKTMQGALTAQVPFVRRLGQPSLNVLGQQVNRPYLQSFASEGKAPGELWRVLAEKQAWVPMPNRDQVVGDKRRGPDHWRVLTDDEFYDFVKDSGERIQARLENRLSKLEVMDSVKAKKLVHDIAEEERSRAKRHIK